MSESPRTMHEMGQPQPPGLSTAERTRYAVARLRCRMSRTGAQIKRLSHWLEEDLFPAADKVSEETLTLKPQEDGRIAVERAEPEDAPYICDCHDLVNLLRRLSIHTIRMDTRLESNQIQDVLVLLAACKRKPGSTEASAGLDGMRRKLRSEAGLHFNCMHVRHHNGVLIVRYSYCLTRLSLAVRWFERRHRRFSDHRALFHAAPRYGLGVVALTGAVLAGYLLTGSVTFLVVAMGVQAVVLFTAVYVFMRGMGSVEYDREESAYRLAQAHAKVTEYTRRIGRDLDLARTVQRKLLPVPNRMPLGDHVEWASHFEPETEVGGDYFDVAALDEHRASVVFADVSGHGMSAALITVIVKMAFLFWVEAGWSLSEFVLCVNRELCRLTPEGSFVVLVAAIYDGKDGCLRFVNAGHSPEPFFLPADTGAPVRVLSQRGSMLLGVRANIEVAEATQPLAPGDAVLFATDGLNEAQNSRGELYGKQRLLRRLVEHRARPLEPLVSAVLDDIDNFTAGIEQTDDRTLLAFRVRPSGKQFAGTK